jgi:hypothetical protein
LGEGDRRGKAGRFGDRDKGEAELLSEQRAAFDYVSRSAKGVNATPAGTRDSCSAIRPYPAPAGVPAGSSAAMALRLVQMRDPRGSGTCMIMRAGGSVRSWRPLASIRASNRTLCWVRETWLQGRFFFLLLLLLLLVVAGRSP